MDNFFASLEYRENVFRYPDLLKPKYFLWRRTNTKFVHICYSSFRINDAEAITVAEKAGSLANYHSRILFNRL